MAITAATHAMGAGSPDQSSGDSRVSELKTYDRGARGRVRARRHVRAEHRARVCGGLAARRQALVVGRWRLARLERRCRLASRRDRLKERSGG